MLSVNVLGVAVAVCCKFIEYYGVKYGCEGRVCRTAASKHTIYEAP